MVIVKLYGGLGNQMYQFAAGKSLARRLNTAVLLDLEWFKHVKNDPELTLRHYELDGFGILPPRMRAKDKLALKLNHPKVFKESFFGYLKEFEELSGNIILDGYWQSYKYFELYNKDIISEFKFPSKPKPRNKKIIKDIKSSNSVLIHVRRGDYNTKRGKQFHGLLPMNYYNKAVADISKRVKQPMFFIFSDEIEWCRQNFDFKYPTEFIDSNSSNTGPEDMQMMSACKHMIIANSSFSWWAAWLNRNPDKIVYAPLAWFKGAGHIIDDRIPPSWIKI